MNDAWAIATDRWLDEYAAAGKSFGTMGVRRAHLRWLYRDHPHTPDPWSITRGDLVRWMAAHPDWRPETRRSVRTSLRRFYAWAEEEGHLPLDGAGRPVNPAAKLPPVLVPPPVARPADDEVIRDVMARAKPREILMISLMAESALRRAEVAQVHRVDLLADCELLVHGKGGKPRVVPLVEVTWRALWAATEADGWAFPNGFGGHLSSAHVGVLLRRLLPVGTTPHMFRHAAASALDAAGVPLNDIRDLLGHASLATTQRYVKVRRDRLAAGVRTSAARLRAPRLRVAS